MPRIRTIKPEFWLSPQVMNLSHSGRLMFIGLITQADDDGRGLVDARRLKAAIFPGDECALADIEGWLAEVACERLAILYTDSKGIRLYQLTGWSKHQKVPKPTPSNYESPTGTLPDDSGSATVGSERIGKDRKGTEARVRARDDDSPGQAPEAAPELPPGLDPAVWKRWCHYRTTIRRPLKSVSIPAAQRELAAFGADQSAVVEQSIAQGWQGLFELKRGNGPAKPQPVPKREKPATPDEIAEARRKAAAENAESLQRLGLTAPPAAMPR